MRELYTTSKYYDFFYTEDVVSDSQFWRDMALESPGPILELGCGTGRVTLDLARSGHEVVGLDISEGMLDAAQKKASCLTVQERSRLELVHGDMAGFDLGRKFGLIIVPFRAFQHLLTVEAQKGCLLSVRRHLASEGRFVVTLFNPNMQFMVTQAQFPARCYQFERVEPETGHTIRRYGEQRYNFPEQCFDAAFIYERIDQDGMLISTEYDPFKLRWTWRYEMEHLLNLTGLSVEALYGNYQRVPFPKASGELIFVCKKAAG